jgi:hypothetical protein
MAIAVTNIGTDAQKNWQTLVLPVPAGGVPAGSLIVFGWSENNNFASRTPTDTKSNTYQAPASLVATSGAVIFGQINYCYNCIALTSTDTISVNVGPEKHANKLPMPAIPPSTLCAGRETVYCTVRRRCTAEAAMRRSASEMGRRLFTVYRSRWRYYAGPRIRVVSLTIRLGTGGPVVTINDWRRQWGFRCNLASRQC